MRLHMMFDGYDKDVSQNDLWKVMGEINQMVSLGATAGRQKFYIPDYENSRQHDVTWRITS